MTDIIKQALDEALTIPEKNAGPVEKKLREKLRDKSFDARYPNFKYQDVLVRCCRRDETAGIDAETLENTYLHGLSNIMDMFAVYETAKKDYLRQRLHKKVSFTRSDGKTLELDPIRDFGKIGRLSALNRFIDQFDRLVHSDTSIETTFQKYAVTDEDRKNIRLIGWNDDVMVWGTKLFEPSQKFAVQLWQNIETIDSAGEYGHPERQCPYCTHAKSHWDRHAENADYEQFWYLSIPDGAVPTKAGTLEDPAVVKTYNALKGKGPDILCAQNDSAGDWCDRNDLPLGEMRIDVENLEDEYETQYPTDPDAYDNDGDDYRGGYDTAEPDFHGHLQSVQELSKRLFHTGRPPTYRKQEWESDGDYGLRVFQATRSKQLVTLKSEQTSEYIDFDTENDVWYGSIHLGRRHFENGRLKFRLPRKFSGNLTVSDAEIASFEGFPDEPVKTPTTVLQFSGCRLPNGFAGFPDLKTGHLDIELDQTETDKIDILGHTAGCASKQLTVFVKPGSEKIRLTTDGKQVGVVQRVRLVVPSSIEFDMSGFAADATSFLIEHRQGAEKEKTAVTNASFYADRVLVEETWLRYLMEKGKGSFGVRAGETSVIQGAYCDETHGWTGDMLRRLLETIPDPSFTGDVRFNGGPADLRGLPPQRSLRKNIVPSRNSDDPATKPVLAAFSSGRDEYFRAGGFEPESVPVYAAIRGGLKDAGVTVVCRNPDEDDTTLRVMSDGGGGRVAFYDSFTGESVDEETAYARLRHAVVKDKGTDDGAVACMLRRAGKTGRRCMFMFRRPFEFDGIDMPNVDIRSDYGAGISMRGCRVRSVQSSAGIRLERVHVTDGVYSEHGGGELFAENSEIGGRTDQIQSFSKATLRNCRLTAEPGVRVDSYGRVYTMRFVDAKSAEGKTVIDLNAETAKWNGWLDLRPDDAGTANQTIRWKGKLDRLVVALKSGGSRKELSPDEIGRLEGEAGTVEIRRERGFENAAVLPRGLRADRISFEQDGDWTFSPEFENSCGAKELFVKYPPRTFKGMPWFQKVTLGESPRGETKTELDRYFIGKSDTEYVPKKEFFKDGRLKFDDVSESMPEWSRILGKIR